MVDLDGNTFDIPPWTGTSEGAATVITAMIDPTITSEFSHEHFRKVHS